MRELVNSHIKLKRQVGAVARRETPTFGLGHGPDFPGNDGSYPALPQPEINEYRCWMHTGRCRTYHYLPENKLWVSDTEFPLTFDFGKSPKYLLALLNSSETLFLSKIIIYMDYSGTHTEAKYRKYTLFNGDEENEVELLSLKTTDGNYHVIDIEKQLEYDKFLYFKHSRKGSPSSTRISATAFYRIIG